MRLFEIFEILYEATPGQLLKRTGIPEQLEQTWLQKYQQEMPANEIMNKLVSLAPSNNVNTYIEWLTKLFLKDPAFDANNEEIKTILQVHSNNRQHLDPNPMSYKSYQSMIDDIERYERESGKSTVDRTKKREGEKAGISGEGVKTIIPGKMYQLDQKAAEKFGADTWCIATPEASEKEHRLLFNEYSNYGQEPFFMLTIPEMKPEYSKIGIFPGEHGKGEFQDRMNRKLSSEEIHDIWRAYPEIYEKIKPYVKNIKWSLPEDEGKQYLNKDVDIFNVIDYIRDVRSGERWPQYEEIIKTDPEKAVLYAKYIIGGRFEEAEPYIIRSHDDTVDYVGKIIRDRWPEAEKYIKDKGDIDDILFYAKDVIKGRWPEVEELIKTDPEAAAFYAHYVLRNRWPEAEDIINSDPMAKRMYDGLLSRLDK